MYHYDQDGCKHKIEYTAWVYLSRQSLTHKMPKVIPQKKLDLGYSKLVHVQGWNPGACFRYQGTTNGQHILITPKTKQVYNTSNALLYTKKHEGN
jgi:hypothetical protein